MRFTKSIYSRRQAAWMMLLILLLAFGLRMYHLDFQSFWTDEGRSLTRASAPLGQIAAVTPVEHMPTYFVMLHGWIGLAGASDFSLRFISVLPSVLAIALAYGFAVDLGSRRAGLVAALLLATGGLQVWYAQEARMYTWLLATSLLSIWLFWRLLTRWPAETDGTRDAALSASPGALSRRRREFYLTFAGYVLATAASIYLHHFGFVVPLTQTIFALLWLAVTRDLRAFLRWVVAGFAVVLLYLPFISRLISMTSYSGWQRGIIPVNRIPLYYFTAYVAGDTMPEPWHTWLPWLYLALIAAGFVAWRRTNRLGGLLLLLGTVTPILAAWELARVQPQFHQRYTTLATGPLLLLAANGFFLFDPVGAAERRKPFATWAAAALLAGVIGANFLALHQLYTNSDVQKLDYRAAAARIEEEGLPGDVILAFTTSWETTFLHYYHGDLPLFNMLPIEHAPPEQASAVIKEDTAGARRAWLVEDYGGAKPDRTWLGQAGWPASESNYNGLYLSLYGMPALPQVELPVQAQFGPDLLLTGVTLAGGAGDEGTAFRAGDVVGVTTHWEALKATKPLKFSLRLLDATGRAFVVTDYLPQDNAPTHDPWQPGAPQRDLRGILLSPDLPPGEHTISLTLYDPETGAITPAGDESALQLAQIQVAPATAPPKPEALPIPARLHARMGEELELLGYGVEPDPARPDATETLYLWWRALSPPAQPYQVQAKLVGRNGETVSDSVQPLSSAPADTWGEGQIVGARYPLALGPAADAGPYQLWLTLIGPDGAAVTPPLDAGQIKVKTRSRTYTLPRAGKPLDMRLGDKIMLRKYAFDGPVVAGDELRLTLYWQADDRITEPYKVFVHLVDAAGSTVAQADSIPTLAGGAAPTESWRKGEVIADTHLLTVPAAGSYRVLVGLYDPVSGERLPVRDAAGQPVDDAAIFVTEVQATEPLSGTPGGAN